MNINMLRGATPVVHPLRKIGFDILVYSVRNDSWLVSYTLPSSASSIGSLMKDLAVVESGDIHIGP